MMATISGQGSADHQTFCILAYGFVMRWVLSLYCSCSCCFHNSFKQFSVTMVNNQLKFVRNIIVVLTTVRTVLQSVFIKRLWHNDTLELFRVSYLLKTFCKSFGTQICFHRFSLSVVNFKSHQLHESACYFQKKSLWAIVQDTVINTAFSHYCTVDVLSAATFCLRHSHVIGMAGCGK